MSEDWMNETMADLAKDSPYYDELRERCPDCGGPIGFSVCRGHRPDLYDDWDGPDPEPDEEGDDE